MSGRHRSTFSQVQRDLYLTQRGMGTVRAMRRGPAPLAKRLVRRRLTRSFFGALRKGGLW